MCTGVSLHGPSPVFISPSARPLRLLISLAVLSFVPSSKDGPLINLIAGDRADRIGGVRALSTHGQACVQPTSETKEEPAITQLLYRAGDVVPRPRLFDVS